jgi:hypothetical protein
MHIMLDLETWGKSPGCDIRSIGAVVFDPVAGYVAKHHPQARKAETFYIATDNPRTLSGNFRYPLIRDPSTVRWWSEQSEEAQAAFANPVDLRDACLQFGKWLYALTDTAWYPEHHLRGFEHVRIWANDPHFDVFILYAVYQAIGLPVPWHYRAPRSMKTICDAAGMTRDDYCNYGEAHNALDDAIAQAMTVCEAYKRLGLSK